MLKEFCLKHPSVSTVPAKYFIYLFKEMSNVILGLNKSFSEFLVLELF